MRLATRIAVSVFLVAALVAVALLARSNSHLRSQAADLQQQVTSLEAVQNGALSSDSLDTSTDTPSPASDSAATAVPLNTRVKFDGGYAIVLAFQDNRPSCPSCSPDPGHRFSAIEAEICSSSQGLKGQEEDFALELTDHTRADTAGFRPTDEFKDATLGPGECDRGWIAFSVPSGITGAFALYAPENPSTASRDTLGRWKVG